MHGHGHLPSVAPLLLCSQNAQGWCRVPPHLPPFPPPAPLDGCWPPGRQCATPLPRQKHMRDIREGIACCLMCSREPGAPERQLTANPSTTQISRAAQRPRGHTSRQHCELIRTVHLRPDMTCFLWDSNTVTVLGECVQRRSRQMEHQDRLLCHGVLQHAHGKSAHLGRQLAGVARALALHVHEARVALALPRECPHAAAVVVVLAVPLGRQPVPARLVGRRIQVA